ncbi:MAG: UPF0164 family protein [Spirochaetales bacterium]|nr:UPF0164 family protein [Spirochaetales bacterium]
MKKQKKVKTVIFLLILIFTQNFLLYSDLSDVYYEISRAFSIFNDPYSGATIFPVLDIPLGGRAEAMGGAFTAVSDDITGLEVNPAGTAMLSMGELAIFHRNWIDDSAVSSLAYASRYGSLGFGVYTKLLYMSFDEYGSFGEEINQGYYSEALLSANLSYNLLPRISQGGLSLGLSVKSGYRLLPAFIKINEEQNQQLAALLFDLGFLTRLNLLKLYQGDVPNFSFGISAKNLGFSSNGEALPGMVTFGLAYRLFSPFLISLDMNMPLSLNPFALQYNRWSLNLGMELKMLKFLAFQTGFKLQENPVFNFGMQFDLDQVKFNANYNLDLSGSLNPVDKFSLEVSFKMDSLIPPPSPEPAPTPKPVSDKPVSDDQAKSDKENKTPLTAEKDDDAAKLDEIASLQDGQKSLVDQIRFVPGTDEFREGAEGFIKKIAQKIKENENLWLSVSAYAEFSGNPTKEINLYTKRANKIKTVLVKSNISEERVKISSTGQITMDPEKDTGLVVIKSIAPDKAKDSQNNQLIENLLNGDHDLNGNGSVVVDSSLYQRLSEAKAGTKINFKGIYFEDPGNRLSVKSHQALDPLADVLKNRETMVILISGYSERLNNILDEFERYTARASSVKKYLVSQGIDASRVKVSSSGELYSPESGSDPNIVIKVLEVDGERELE